jgi:tellurite resistance protein TerC
MCHLVVAKPNESSYSFWSAEWGNLMLELISNKIFLWIAFNVFVLAMLALDLGVFHRRAHAVSIKEALIWTLIWTVVTLLFNLWVYWMRGANIALQFLTGFLIERALSVDNLFVFLMIFSYFAVKAKYQHRVLMWGILGALVMRAGMIFLGVALINAFHWVLYLFGGFLIITGIRMGLQKEEEIHPERNIVVRLVRKIFPITRDYHEGKFFVRMNGLKATPLFIVVVAIEVSDLVFALDSIPAIFAVTTDPFIIYTSNVFAILGLRALYFALAGVMNLFVHLKYGLAFILSFVGVKMVLADIFPIPIGVALGVVAGALAVTMLTSVIWPAKQQLPIPPKKHARE